MAGKIGSAPVLPYEPGLEGESEFPGGSMFRMVAESFHGVGFSMLDPAGVIVAWNSWATRMDGWSAEEVVGRHLSSIFPVEEAERGKPEDWLRASRGSGRFEDEVWRTRKDGTRYWAMVTLTALREAGDRVSGYLLVTRDLSQKRAESEVARLANAQMNALMDSTADGILQINRDWIIVYGNRKAVDSLPDFKLGGNLWECFPELLNTPVEDSLFRVMEERVATSWENHYAPYNLWYRSRAFPTEDGISLFYTDITVEKTMQNQLSLEQILREKRIEALSHMAGGLAHEINNPLAIIHALASDLEVVASGKDEVPAEEVRLACQNIVRTSDRATRVLRALQGFAREAGTDPMLPAGAGELLQQCADLLEGRFLRGDVAFCLDVEPNLPLIVCRETQIRQIVTNLLNNALDAIDHAGSAVRWISLTAKRAGNELAIEVIDSGPGIEEQFRTHVMDPFFTAKVRGLGMGVGLSLSRTIAQEHGGTLELVDSHQATCFRLTLPLAREEVLENGRAADEETLGERQGKGLDS